MIIDVDAAGKVALLEADDFKKFKVRTALKRASLGDLRRALDGVATVPDEETAWVSEDRLRAWPHPGNTDAWKTAFGEMVAKAAKYGWVDAERLAVKAHIEWPA